MVLQVLPVLQEGQDPLVLQVLVELQDPQVLQVTELVVLIHHPVQVRVL